MNEAFHATLKLITGEEVLAEVCLSEEHGTEFFIVSDPIVVNETMQIDPEKGVAMAGLVPKKWQNYAADGMSIIYRNHVISVSELDKFGIEFYEKALLAAKMSTPVKKRVSSEDNIGFVGKVDNARVFLENMYNISKDVPE